MTTDRANTRIQTDAASSVPADVCQLVIAARIVWETETPTAEELRDLDIALEAFAGRVPYGNEPEAAR